MPNRLSIEDVRALLDSKGYILLTETYQNAKQKLKVKCKNGHIKEITLSRVGYKAQTCHLCIARQALFSLEYVRSIFEKEGYVLLSETYSGARSKLSVKCPNGHLWSVNLNKFKNTKRRCPLCSMAGGISKMEIELFDIIKKAYPSTKRVKVRHLKIPRRPYIEGFDIDMYVPELKRGIEFDGTYYHSIEGLKRGRRGVKWPKNAIKNYHTIKDNYFLTKGIDILHVKEEDWIKDRNKCLENIFAFLRK